MRQQLLAYYNPIGRTFITRLLAKNLASSAALTGLLQSLTALGLK
jgi:hypothetical protein